MGWGGSGKPLSALGVHNLTHNFKIIGGWPLLANWPMQFANDSREFTHR